MNPGRKYYLVLITFLVLQVVWFNHIRLFGYYSPVVFIYPFLILPLSKNESSNLLLAFASGLFIDIVSNTGGVYTATAVFVTYTRKIYFITLKNPTQKIEEINIDKISPGQKIIYFFIFILLSNIIIYFLDSFSFGLVISKWKDIIINSLISILFIVFTDLIFFNPAKR